jgi:hypothetical protein
MTEQNNDLYKITIESFGVKKPSKILIQQAKNISKGIKPDTRLIKMEVARAKLLEKPSVTAKHPLKINELTGKIDEYLAKPKPEGKRKAPIDPRKVKKTEETVAI